MSVILKLLATVRCCALPSQGDDKRPTARRGGVGAVVVAARVVVHSTVVDFQLADSLPNTRASTGSLGFGSHCYSSACHIRPLCELEL
jgi:hypothetical protein